MQPASVAGVRAEDVQTGAYGLVFNLLTHAGAAQLLTRLVGAHNISNLLLVVAVLQELGWDLFRVARVLATLRPVEGPLQMIAPLARTGAGRAATLVVVDYAHTPDAFDPPQLSMASAGTVTAG